MNPAITTHGNSFKTHHQSIQTKHKKNHPTRARRDCRDNRRDTAPRYCGENASAPINRVAAHPATCWRRVRTRHNRSGKAPLCRSHAPLPACPFLPTTAAKPTIPHLPAIHSYRHHTRRATVWTSRKYCPSSLHHTQKAHMVGIHGGLPTFCFLHVATVGKVINVPPTTPKQTASYRPRPSFFPPLIHSTNPDLPNQ